MDFIVDSSVAAKWVVDEPGRENAIQLISPDVFLRAPDWIVSELANVFWKNTVRGDLTRAGASGRL